MLSADELKKNLFYDESTGIFTWIVNKKRNLIGTKAIACDAYGYVKIYLNGKHYKAHRLAWLYTYNKFPLYDIDHVDGNRKNNKIENLRDVKHIINSGNFTKKTVRSTTGFLGVSKIKGTGKFRATIQVNRKSIHIGIFDTAESAYEAYIIKKREVHVGCYL